MCNGSRQRKAASPHMYLFHEQFIDYQNGSLITKWLFDGALRKQDVFLTFVDKN